MSRGLKNFMMQSALAVGGAFGGTYLAHLMSGKAYNITSAIIISVGGILGLLIAKCTGRLK